MLNKILGWFSLILFIGSFFFLFNDSLSDHPGLFLFTLLGSALLGSISLYINDRKIENRKLSLARVAIMVTLIITSIAVLIITYYSLMWAGYS